MGLVPVAPLPLVALPLAVIFRPLASQARHKFVAQKGCSLRESWSGLPSLLASLEAGDRRQLFGTYSQTFSICFREMPCFNHSYESTARAR